MRRTNAAHTKKYTLTARARAVRSRRSTLFAARWHQLLLGRPPAMLRPCAVRRVASVQQRAVSCAAFHLRLGQPIDVVGALGALARRRRWR